MTTKTPSTPASSTEPVKFGNTNNGGVSNNPSQPTVYTFATPVTIISITNYHWNDGKGTTSPGTIALKHSDGTVYGPWSTSGTLGQGGVPNAYWTANPSVTIKAGKYTVIDSDTSTWAQNSGSGNAGMTWGTYSPAASGSSGVTSAVTTTTSSSASTSGYIYVLKDIYVLGAGAVVGKLPTKDDPVYESGYIKWCAFSSLTTATVTIECTADFIQDPKMAHEKSVYTWTVAPSLTPDGTVERTGTGTLLETSGSSKCSKEVLFDGQIGMPHGQYAGNGYTDRSCQPGDTKKITVITDVPSATENNFKDQKPFRLGTKFGYGQVDYYYVLQRT